MAAAKHPPEYGAFYHQRWCARLRGIAWELTFDEWLGIWKASGHLHERGRKRGQYVMSRNGDAGPYAVGNVSIKQTGDNMREALLRLNPAKPKRGEGRGVHHIYPGAANGWIARVGRKVIGHYATEAEAVLHRTSYIESVRNPFGFPGKEHAAHMRSFLGVARTPEPTPSEA